MKGGRGRFFIMQNGGRNMKQGLKRSLFLVGVLTLALVMILGMGMLSGSALASGAEDAAGGAVAAQGAGNGFDFTGIAVSVIGTVGMVLAALLGVVVRRYVIPWLEDRNLMDAAEIVVNAVEAIKGRYMGPEKWAMALERMKAKGYNIDCVAVLDALKAAWQKLDIAQVAAGVKEVEEGDGEKI